MISGQSTDRSMAARVMPLTLPSKAKAYFIRLSIQPQQPRLGYYQAGQFYLSDYGSIVADEWVRSATNRKGIELDQWMMTPHELCGIVFIQSPAVGVLWADCSSGPTPPKPWLLSSFITSVKAATAKRMNLRGNQLGQPVWRPNYQEQWIQDAAALAQVRQQISTDLRQDKGA